MDDVRLAISIYVRHSDPQIENIRFFTAQGGVASIQQNSSRAENGDGKPDLVSLREFTVKVGLPQAFSSVQPQLREQSEIAQIIMQTVVDRPDLQAR
jgi:hypothetical protein